MSNNAGPDEEKGFAAFVDEFVRIITKKYFVIGSAVFFVIVLVTETMSTKNIMLMLLVGGICLAIFLGWAMITPESKPGELPKQSPLRQVWNWKEARRLEKLVRKDIVDDHERTKEIISLEHKNALAVSRAQTDSFEYLEELRHDYGFRELRHTSKVDLKRQKRELERDYYKIDQDFRAISKKINADLVKDVLDLISDLIKWYSAKSGRSVADRIRELQDIQEQVRRMQASGNYTAQDIRRILDALMTDFARTKA